jgi:host factor-I protein
MDFISKENGVFARAIHGCDRVYGNDAGETQMKSDEEQIQQQEDFLESLKTRHTPVSAFLVNGIRLTGYIEAFDQYVLMLRSATGVQMIYKHAVSTVQEYIGKSPPVTSAGASAREDGKGTPAPNISHRKSAPGGFKRFSKRVLPPSLLPSQGA